MIDLALNWDAEGWAAGLILSGGSLETTSGMRSAILISLFTDARAPDGAELPEDGIDTGGWWGNAFGGVAGDQQAQPNSANDLGSLLWLLRRSKVTAKVLRDARQYTLDALAWLLRDGIARQVDAEVEAQGDRLAIAVFLVRPSGPGRERYDFTWEASA